MLIFSVNMKFVDNNFAPPPLDIFTTKLILQILYSVSVRV